jgi:hypothetical protein
MVLQNLPDRRAFGAFVDAGPAGDDVGLAGSIGSPVLSSVMSVIRLPWSCVMSIR